MTSESERGRQVVATKSAFCDALDKLVSVLREDSAALPLVSCVTASAVAMLDALAAAVEHKSAVPFSVPSQVEQALALLRALGPNAMSCTSGDGPPRVVLHFHDLKDAHRYLDAMVLLGSATRQSESSPVPSHLQLVHESLGVPQRRVYVGGEGWVSRERVLELADGIRNGDPYPWAKVDDHGNLVEDGA